MTRRSRLLKIAVAVAILVLVVAAAVWVGAVEHWIGQQLRSLAAAHLNPSFGFDDLSYRFPRTITLRGIRLTSPDPEAPREPIEILAMDSLTLVRSHIPRPNRPFRMQRLDLSGPTLRLVRIPVGVASGSLLGFSDLLKEESESAAHPARPPARASDLFQVRTVSIRAGRTEFDPRDGSAAILLIDGIIAKLLLQPSDAGAYAIDSLSSITPFSLSGCAGSSSPTTNDSRSTPSRPRCRWHGSRTTISHRPCRSAWRSATSRGA